jgi:RNA polymerase sigma-70 factor (ECF subfamily)
MSSQDHSTQIQRCIDRMLAGDASARDELLAQSSDRLTRLTRKMLRDFPGVRRWEQTDDVLQNAALRLCRALEQVKPSSAAHFFRLAAAQIRRELLDLARHHSGLHGVGASRYNGIGSGKPPVAGVGLDAVDTTHDPGRIAAWTDFHRAIESLPTEELEVFDLLFYQGLPQAEAAAVLGISERSIKRRWQAARLRLAQDLGGALPGL